MPASRARHTKRLAVPLTAPKLALLACYLLDQAAAASLPLTRATLLREHAMPTLCCSSGT